MQPMRLHIGSNGPFEKVFEIQLIQLIQLKELNQDNNRTNAINVTYQWGYLKCYPNLLVSKYRSAI